MIAAPFVAQPMKPLFCVFPSNEAVLLVTVTGVTVPQQPAHNSASANSRLFRKFFADFTRVPVRNGLRGLVNRRRFLFPNRRCSHVRRIVYVDLLGPITEERRNGAEHFGNG